MVINTSVRFSALSTASTSIAASSLGAVGMFSFILIASCVSSGYNSRSSLPIINYPREKNTKAEIQSPDGAYQFDPVDQ
jgi:hypothetical protein